MENVTIGIEQLLERLERGEPLLVLDVRDVEKYHTGSLEIAGIQTRNIPYVTMQSEFEGAKHQMNDLPRDTPIVTICTTGNKARKAAQVLREQGYSAVSLEGGLTAWMERSSRTNP